MGSSKDFTRQLKLIQHILHCFFRKTNTKYQPICKPGCLYEQGGKATKSSFVFFICGSGWRPNHLIYLVLDLLSPYITLKYLTYTQNKEIS